MSNESFHLELLNREWLYHSRLHICHYPDMEQECPFKRYKGGYLDFLNDRFKPEFPVDLEKDQDFGQNSGQPEFPVENQVKFAACLDSRNWHHNARLDNYTCTVCGTRWNAEHPPESHTITRSEPVVNDVDKSANDISLLVQAVSDLSANLANVFERLDQIEHDAKMDTATLIMYVHMMSLVSMDIQPVGDYDYIKMVEEGREE